MLHRWRLQNTLLALSRSFCASVAITMETTSFQKGYDLTFECLWQRWNSLQNLLQILHVCFYSLWRLGPSICGSVHQTSRVSALILLQIILCLLSACSIFLKGNVTFTLKRFLKVFIQSFKVAWAFVKIITGNGEPLFSTEELSKTIGHCSPNDALHCWFFICNSLIKSILTANMNSKYLSTSVCSFRWSFIGIYCHVC